MLSVSETRELIALLDTSLESIKEDTSNEQADALTTLRNAALSLLPPRRIQPTSCPPELSPVEAVQVLVQAQYLSHSLRLISLSIALLPLHQGPPPTSTSDGPPVHLPPRRQKRSHHGKFKPKGNNSARSYTIALLRHQAEGTPKTLKRLNSRLRKEEKVTLPFDGFVFTQPRVGMDPMGLEPLSARGRGVLEEYGLLVSRHEGGLGSIPFAIDPQERPTPFEEGNKLHIQIQNVPVSSRNLQIFRIQPLTSLVTSSSSSSSNHDPKRLRVFPRMTSTLLSEIEDKAVLYKFGTVLRDEGLSLMADFVESSGVEAIRPPVMGDVIAMMIQVAEVELGKIGKTLEDLKDHSWYMEFAEEAWAKMDAGGDELPRTYSVIGPSALNSLDDYTRIPLALPPNHLLRMMREDLDGVTTAQWSVGGHGSLVLSRVGDCGLASYDAMLAGLGGKCWAWFAPQYWDAITQYLWKETTHLPSSLPLSNDLQRLRNLSSPLRPLDPPTTEHAKEDECSGRAQHRRVAFSPVAISLALGIPYEWHIQLEGELLLIHPKSYHQSFSIGVPVNLAANYSYHSDAFIFPQRCRCGQSTEPNPRWGVDDHGDPVDLKEREMAERLAREWVGETADAADLIRKGV